MVKNIYKLKGGRVVYNPNARDKWRGINSNGEGDANFLNLLNVRCIEEELEDVPQKYKHLATDEERSIKGYLYQNSYKNIYSAGPYQFSLSEYVNRYLRRNNYNQIQILKAYLENAKAKREEDRTNAISKDKRTSTIDPENNNHDKIIYGINNLIEKVTDELQRQKQQRQEEEKAKKQKLKQQKKEQHQQRMGFAALYSTSDEEDSPTKSSKSESSKTRSSKSKSKSKSNTRSAGNINKSRSKPSKRKKKLKTRRKKKKPTKKNK